MSTPNKGRRPKYDSAGLAFMIWIGGNILLVVFPYIAGGKAPEAFRENYCTFFGIWAGFGLPVLVFVLMKILGEDEASSQEPTSHRYGPEYQYPSDWESIRREVLARDGYRCGNCGGTESLHVHHIVPLSRGGTNGLTNLRTLCENCHKKIHPHMRD
jgi:hypothetical protein